MQNIGKVLQKILDERAIKYDFDEMIKAALKDPEVQDFIKEHHAELTPDALNKSAANVYEFVTQRDKVQQESDSTVSGFAPKLIVNNGLIDVEYGPTEQTRTAVERTTQAHKMRLIDLPITLREAAITEFERTEGRIRALALATEFVAQLSAGQNPKGVYFSGNFGVGKTYLMAAMANKLVTFGKSVTLIHVPTFIAGLSSHFGDNSLNDEVQKLKSVDVLMLDDIGAESLSQWSRDDVLGVILQYRMENQLPTVFSSNFSFPELEEHFAETKTGSEPVKAARLMERIKFLATEVVMEGANRRNRG